MTHSKAELRRRIRASRAARFRGGFSDEAAGLGLSTQWENACLFFGVRPWSEECVPALFVPTASEPPVWSILARSPRSLLPVLWDHSVESENPILLSEPAWGLHHSGDSLVENPHPWPAQAALPVVSDVWDMAGIVAVPALAVDEDGARLGQGGGWYDRALSLLQPDVMVIGVIFDEEFLPGGTIPLEPHDRLVDAVITPHSFIPLPVHGA